MPTANKDPLYALRLGLFSMKPTKEWQLWKMPVDRPGTLVLSVHRTKKEALEKLKTREPYTDAFIERVEYISRRVWSCKGE